VHAIFFLGEAHGNAHKTSEESAARRKHLPDFGASLIGYLKLRMGVLEHRAIISAMKQWRTLSYRV
jgi:hypothetical protein